MPAGSQDSDLPLPVFIILEYVLLSYLPKDIVLIDMFLEIYWVKWAANLPNLYMKS